MQKRRIQKMQFTKQINLNCTVFQSDGNIVSNMGGEKVMMSVQNGKYYNLGEIGGAIWDWIKSPVTVKQVVKKLLSEYEVEEGECQQQVISFLTQLLNENLIIIKP